MDGRFHGWGRQIQIWHTGEGRTNNEEKIRWQGKLGSREEAWGRSSIVGRKIGGKLGSREETRGWWGEAWWLIVGRKLETQREAWWSIVGRKPKGNLSDWWHGGNPGGEARWLAIGRKPGGRRGTGEEGS